MSIRQTSDFELLGSRPDLQEKSPQNFTKELKARSNHIKVLTYQTMDWLPCYLYPYFISKTKSPPQMITAIMTP